MMITGDNPLTAAAIAAEAGVDDFIAEATPEKKLAYIRQEQADGRLVAMCGDGANDAPALAQADVGLAMNGDPGRQGRRATWWISTQPHQAAGRGAGGQAAAGDPWRPDHLLHRQRRGQVLPPSCGPVYRRLSAAGGAEPDAAWAAQSAILSAIIFNALIIVALGALACAGSA